MRSDVDNYEARAVKSEQGRAVITEKQTVAILGAGYGGIATAFRLSRLLGREWHILLFDREPVHQLVTRLPEVLSGVLHPDRCRVPYREFLPARVRYVQAQVESIDTDKRQVGTSVGRVEARFIVVALGSEPDYQRIPGSEQNVWEIKSVQRTAQLHLHLRRLLRQAIGTKIVVLGGGYTGTEVAGQLAEWSSRLMKSERGPQISVTLVNDEPFLLHGLNLRLSEAARRILERKGVALSLGVPVSSVAPGVITLADGASLGADVVVWGAGTRAASAAITTSEDTGQEGRLIVDRFLRTPHQGIYVVGDSSLALDYIRGEAVPSSAQLAVQEGTLAAENIAANIASRPPRAFHSHLLGEALSLGGTDGAAEVAGVIVTGRLALAVKEAALLRYLRRLGGPRLALAYR